MRPARLDSPGSFSHGAVEHFVRIREAVFLAAGDAIVRAVGGGGDDGTHKREEKRPLPNHSEGHAHQAREQAYRQMPQQTIREGVILSRREPISQSLHVEPSLPRIAPTAAPTFLPDRSTASVWKLLRPARSPDTQGRGCGRCQKLREDRRRRALSEPPGKMAMAPILGFCLRDVGVVIVGPHQRHEDELGAFEPALLLLANSALEEYLSWFWIGPLRAQQQCAGHENRSE